MPGDRKNVTIYQIAEESGVSVSTVSRVLNNSPNVSSKAYDRVKSVIDRYNFTPSAVARAMISNRTSSIGIVMPDITNPYFSALFLEIQRYALTYNYSLILSNTLYGGSSHGVASSINEMQYFQIMMEKKVDGVIVTGGELDKENISSQYIDALNRLNSNIPVVAIAQSVEGCDCVFVARNLDGGISSLIQHFVALGRRRIGMIGGEPGVKITTARFNAYRQTLSGLALEYDSDVVALSDYYLPDGYDAMQRILESPSANPDAVIAINDMVAMGAIRAIADRGLRVPEDIAVASCDQFMEADYMLPRLTSIDQQNGYLGRLSIMTLISAINGVHDPVNIQHVPRLIIRDSCGAHLQNSGK